ncbi:MAG: DegV family protein [Angelakisella sp.]
MHAQNYIITTDNTTDFPTEFYSRNRLPYIHIDYTIDDICYDGEGTDLSTTEFYDRIRSGAMPITQQANPEKSRLFFEKLLKEGLDILHIAFSSGLSGTYQSNCIAAEELQELYPERKIIIIDSLCASMGEGLLVNEALLRQQAGMTIDEVATWVRENRLHIVHDVVADDLFHLQRGGRVSKTAAVVGTALGIKPMIHLDDNGKLVPYGKMRGKKTALTAMATRLANKIDRSGVYNMVFISHADCLEDAQLLESLIRQKAGVKNLLTSYIGPTIGAHTGVGTVALFYFADSRSTD